MNWPYKIQFFFLFCMWSLIYAFESIEHRNNSWELYGFDYMIDDDNNAWLIEINSSHINPHTILLRYMQCVKMQCITTFSNDIFTFCKRNWQFRRIFEYFTSWARMIMSEASCSRMWEFEILLLQRVAFWHVAYISTGLCVGWYGKNWFLSTRHCYHHLSYNQIHRVPRSCSYVL